MIFIHNEIGHILLNWFLNELKRKGIVDQLWVIGPVTSFKPWEEEYQTIFGKTNDISKNIFRYHGFS